MTLITIASTASFGIGGIVTQLGRLAFRARRLWAAERQQAAIPCEDCGGECSGQICPAWL